MAHAPRLATRVQGRIAILRAVADAWSFGYSERLIAALQSATTSKRTHTAAFVDRKLDLLLVGLQNPGYEDTRHNAGSLLVQQIVKAVGTFGEYRSCDGARVADGTLDEQAVLAVLPSSFMNLNGRCVGNLVRRHGLTPSQVVVVHDDLDLSIGRYKIKRGGSSGGHRGLDSCVSHIGADFWRVRIGIGRPASKDAVVQYVLEEFTSSERQALDASFDRWSSHCHMLPAALAEPAHLSRLLNAIAVGGASARATSDGGGGSGGGAAVSGCGSGAKRQATPHQSEASAPASKSVPNTETAAGAGSADRE